MRLLVWLTLFSFTSASSQIYKERIRELTDSSFFGRGYYKSGDSLAARYLESEFRNTGIIPFDNQGYLQPFTFAVNTFPGKVTVTISGKALQAGKDFIPDPSCRSLKGSFEIFVFDKNILHSKKELKKLDKTDFSNKIIVINKEGFNEKKNKSSKKTDELVSMIRTGQFSNPASIIPEDKLTFGVATFQSHPLFHFVRGIKLKTGDTIHVEMETVLKDPHTAYNVAGYIRGNQYPDSFLFVTAHYDHLGSIGAEAVFPGANDNASGVALMLDIAGRVRKEPLPCSIAFVAFAGEEAGLIGSDHFINHLPVPKEKAGFAVNFDITGTGSEGIAIVNGIKNQGADKLKKVLGSNQEHLPGFAKLLKNPEIKVPVLIRDQAPISDHYRFSEVSIPALYIYTRGGSKAYHDINDVPENLTFDLFEDLSKLIYLYYSGTLY